MSDSEVGERQETTQRSEDQQGSQKAASSMGTPPSTQSMSSIPSSARSLDMNYPESAAVHLALTPTPPKHAHSDIMFPRVKHRSESPNSAPIQHAISDLWSKIKDDFTRVHHSLSGISDRMARLERQVEEMASTLANMKTVHTIVPTHSSRPPGQEPKYAPGI